MSLFGAFRKKDQDRPEGPETAAAGGGLFARLRAGLQKTRTKVSGGLRGVLSLGRGLDEEVLAQIEEQLYLADVGPRTVARLCEGLRAAHKDGRVRNTDEVLAFLKDQMKQELRQWDTALHLPAEGPAVIMVAGVNGSGKTTSIAKLARLFVGEGRRVLLAASDTFRAAAVEQLQIWAERTGADIVKNASADPAAVAFDAAEKASAQGYDVLIIDTAGRLHTRNGLMMELEKVSRVVAKKVPGAPHETLLVLDATTGQNAISQVTSFSASLPVTGIILSKLDGTAKGGIVFGMRDQIDVPVKFIGVGEQADDLIPFDPDQFVEAIFD